MLLQKHSILRHLFTLLFLLNLPTGTVVVAQQPVIRLDAAHNGALASPVLATNARDGSRRLFIVGQDGRIHVLQPGSLDPTVFLNISTKASIGGERGLLGLAFHPRFSGNRRFFVNYTRAGDGATVIAEYRASATDPNVADTAETILLTIPQPFANHNGGMIEFGPDGYLYIGMGDGGSANDPGNRAQNINDLLGKFLRIDVDTPGPSTPYSIPPTNPFAGAIPGRDEIYAYGLRNPWRWSFDRNTGTLYAGDVGQGVREWVHIINAGANYGWATWEGTRCNAQKPTGSPECAALPLIQPFDEYTHANGRCSITGGYVYRGGRGTLPQGAYVYGDYCTGEIFMRHNGQTTLLLDTTFNISSFGEDELGELYAAALGGEVRRIVNPDARPNVATVSAASYLNRTAAGSIASAYGAGLATGSAAWTSGAQPITLAGTTLKIRDAAGVERDAPLFYVSPGQINYLIPAQTAPGTATLTVTSGAGAVSTGAVIVNAVSPAIFTANASATGRPAAYLLRQLADGTQRNEALGTAINPGAPTDQLFLILFGTGIRGRSAQSAVSVIIGAEAATAGYSGPQSDFVGLDQVNVRLPRTLAGAGAVNLTMIVDGQKANVVSLNFQ
ncbi:MAG: PQQ-dependent sugar dehydrogenase [Blastocatellia bacterium]